MKYTERLGNNAVVPVVVLEDAKNAVPTAKALLAGGIDVMEITLRTEAAMDSIRAIARECPEILVGAGTVTTLDQAKAVVDAGARFIVSPGFNREVVEWCVKHDITVTPGCVTPTEIMEALQLGVDVIKFFPANVYGGLAAMKSLSGPFGGIKFIPTGGVDGNNIAEYAAAPFIHTVGGSWVCTKKDISEGNFDKITQLCKDAVDKSLGFEIAHVGINTESADCALAVANAFESAFGFAAKEGRSSVFAGKGIEVMKTMFRGKNGHIAVKTNHVRRAIAYLEKKGLAVDMSNIKAGEKIAAVYLKDEIGGFAVHLLQK